MGKHMGICHVRCYSQCRLKANIGLLMKLAPPQKRQKYDGYWKKFLHISLSSTATILPLKGRRHHLPQMEV